jgi:ABC-type glycerol-3-phosphate transport system substrate-binding protein
VLKRRFALAFLLVFSALALVACGSSSNGDESQIEEAIETSATSTDPADCTKLETQQFMEQTAQESGKAAVTKCEEEAEAEKGAESVSVSGVEVSGSSATAEAALTGGALDGQTVEVELVKNGDQWQLNEVVKFTKFDRAKLVEFVEEEFTPSSANGISPKLASCFVEAFQEGSQAEIEELILSNSSEAFEELAESCQ